MTVMTAAHYLNFPEAVCDAGEDAAATDSDLLLALYDREQASLRRYLLYLGMDAHTAEEAVQESFLKLHEHLLGGGDRSYLKAWLYRVAHNVAINNRLAKSRTATRSLKIPDGRTDPVSQEASAETQLLAREEEERLQAGIRALTQAQRSCLVLRAEGLKYREIAEALNLSVSTVAENVQRGLEKLKAIV